MRRPGAVGGIGLALVATVALVGVLPLNGAAADAVPATAPAFGTVLQGERAAAMGLYLLPWQDAHASSVDRPPSHLDVPLQPMDPAQFEMRARVDAATRAWRLERLQH